MNLRYLNNVLVHRIMNMTLCLLILREKGVMEKAGVFFIKSSLNVPLKLILLLFPENKYITSFAKLLGIITPKQQASVFFFQLTI